MSNPSSQQASPSSASNTDRLSQLFITATPALVSGAVQAVLFNPFDRALYVRVQTRRRRFLDPRNFQRPFQGFANAAAYRTIVGASYIFWQDSFRLLLPQISPSLTEKESPMMYRFLLGLCSGAANGLALNNLQAIKFRMWSEHPTVLAGGSKGTFLSTAIHMYRTGGIAPFYRGCVITVQRDSVFGVIYEGCRNSKQLQAVVEHWCRWLFFSHGPIDTSSSSNLTKKQKKLLKFICDLISAFLATAASSPWNFIRSVGYGTPMNAQPLRRWTLLKFLCIQATYAFRHGESYRKITYHSAPRAPPGSWNFIAAMRSVNRRLNVGWGSLRVGLGMAAGQYVFNDVQEAMMKPTAKAQVA